MYFWLDDWLGYKLVDKLKVPQFMHERLKHKVSQFFFEGVWHFSPDFINALPMVVVVDILLRRLEGTLMFVIGNLLFKER